MKLQVGDRIYRTHYGKITGVYTIERVTATQAICKDAKFKIEYTAGFGIARVGQREWGSASYEIETITLKMQLYRQNVLSKVSQSKFDMLTTDQLERIYKIITE